MMTPNKPASGPMRFQGWELRPEERVLLVDGRPLPVGGRAFEVLLALVERRGRVVTKDELLAAAWAGLVVEENNISVQIAALRKLLGQKAIATVPGRGYQLSAAPLAAAEPAARAPAALDHPPELLGRQADVSEVSRRLANCALVTIVGTGGVGKTSLARELFAQQQGARADDACSWIDLAPIREGRQVVALLAKSFGVELKDSSTEIDALVAALGRMRSVVVLDNCEHVLAELARVVRLALEGAPGIRWLATSQEPLHVAGESVYRLEPLAVPTGRPSAAEAIGYAAVDLLCRRVADADRLFRLADADVTLAIELCAQLDGLPLAIEMVAPRVATFGLAEVHQRLGERLRLLSGGGGRGGAWRHDTLRGTYDWSYGLLSECEQAVFRRLEPFLGGFRADLAQQVASDDAAGGPVDPWRALDALGALVEKSLVQRSAEDPGRFHLLESARDYARSRLDLAGETADVHARHAHAVAARFAPAQADADRMTDEQWLRHYAPERHNARAALAWASRARAPDELARLVTALAMLDWFLCRQAEILQFEVPMDVLAAAAPPLRASAFLELSWAHYSDGDHALGAQLAHEALEIFESAGNAALAYRAAGQLTRLHEARPGMGEAAQSAWRRLQAFDDRQVPLRARLFCAISCGLANRPGFTVERLRELVRLAEDAGFSAIAAIGECNLTDKLLIAGRDAEVVQTADHLLRSQAQPNRAHAFILHNKAVALIRLGRTAEAYEPARLAFQAMPGVAHFLVDAFAFAAVREGRFADAAILHGCGDRIREERHEKPDVSEARAIAETRTVLADALGDAQLGELMALGAAMSAVEALAIKVFPREPRWGATGAPPAVARDPKSSLGVS